jgi:hypothetical protein
MAIHQELDEWAFDIEQAYDNGELISGRDRRKWITLLSKRDKFYSIVCKDIEKLNNLSDVIDGVYVSQPSRYCTNRLNKMDNPPRMKIPKPPKTIVPETMM